MALELGLVLPAGPKKGQIPQWMDDLDTCIPQLSDSFKSLWMTDHFFWEDNPTHEAWTVLAFMAARWPEHTLGPVVLGQSYRNPALTAKMAATLQVLSGGRFILGIGAGWKEDEYHAYGYPFSSPGVRVGQLEDTLEIITRLWKQPGKVSYKGKYYAIADAYCEPKPNPIPPILVGGGGTKTMRLAARFADMWNIPDAGIDRYRACVATLKQHCETLGRDIRTLKLSWFGRLAVGRTEAAALALGYGKWTPNNALVGTPSQIVEQMSAFIEAGAGGFMVEILGLPDPDIIAMVKEVVDKLNNRIRD